jgi:hypothetical protein
MKTSFQVGAVGVSIILYVKENGIIKDISAAMNKIIRLSDDNRVSHDYPASFLTDGSDGGLVYVTTSVNDLNHSGIWQVQVFLDLPGQPDLPTSTATFNVLPNLLNPI